LAAGRSERSLVQETDKTGNLTAFRNGQTRDHMGQPKPSQAFGLFQLLLDKALLSVGTSLRYQKVNLPRALL